MKTKSTILGLSLLLGVSGFLSCEKGVSESDVTPNDKNGKTVTLTLKSDITETRTSISYNESTGKYHPSWEADEHIGVFVGENKNADFENGETASAETCNFIGTLTLTTGNYKVYTYYPYENAVPEPTTADKVLTRIALPSIQYPTLNSFDGKADIMVGYPLDLNLAADETAPLLEGLQFKRLMAVLKIIPSDIASSIGNEPVRSIRLTVGDSYTDAILTGRVELDLEEARISDNGFTYSSAAYKLNYVEAQYDNAADFQLDGTAAAYVVVNPVTIASGKPLTLEITTDNYNITKTIESLPSDMSFVAGEVTPLRMNLSTGTTITSTEVGEPLPFSKDFSDITGNNGSAWTGDNQLTVSGNVYVSKTDITSMQGINAIRLGSGSATGSVATATKLDLSSPFTIIIKGCGWSATEVKLDIVIGETTETVTFDTYKSNYAGEEYYINFEGISNAEIVKFVKSGSSRSIIESIQIVSGTVTPSARIDADDITGIDAEGTENAVAAYKAMYFDDDVQVSATDGTVVTSASALNGTITYSVAENTGTESRNGFITLESAADPTITKTITVTQAGFVSPMTVAELVEAYVSGSTFAAGSSVQGIVSLVETGNSGNFSANTVIVTDNNGAAKSAMVFYTGTISSAVQVGDQVKIKLDNASCKDYYSLREVMGVNAEDVKTISRDNAIHVQTITIDQINSDYQGVYVALENVQPASAVTVSSNPKFSDGTNSITAYTKAAWEYGGKTYSTVTGTLRGFVSQYNTGMQIVPTKLSDIEDFLLPEITANSVTLENASGSTAQITVTTEEGQAWTATASGTGFSISPASGTGSGTITITASADGGTSEAQLGTVTVTLTQYPSISATANVSQKGTETVDATEITVDFSTSPATGFPTATGTTTGEFEIAGYTYKFSAANGFYYFSTNKCLLIGKSGSYIELPAIEGKKLTTVTLSTSSGASLNVAVGIFDPSDNAVSGGEAQTLNARNSDFSYSLTATSVNTSYRVKITNSNNAQFTKIYLKYE